MLNQGAARQQQQQRQRQQQQQQVRSDQTKFQFVQDTGRVNYCPHHNTTMHPQGKHTRNAVYDVLCSPQCCQQHHVLDRLLLLL
jgi:hypothetical protein